MFFQDRGPVPETFARLRQRLESKGIEYIVIGAFACRSHHYNRTTEDVDVCVRAADLQRFRDLWAGREYVSVAGRSRRFEDAESQVTVDLLVSGEIAGNTKKQQSVRFPDPSEAEMLNDIPVPSLARLIELKLVTWRYKDWGDVVELIRKNDLDEAFAARVHQVARSAFLQCYDQMLEEDQYHPEIHDAPPE